MRGLGIAVSLKRVCRGRQLCSGCGRSMAKGQGQLCDASPTLELIRPRGAPATPWATMEHIRRLPDPVSLAHGHQEIRPLLVSLGIV